jgi:20S proteasome subunit beta 3
MLADCWRKNRANRAFLQAAEDLFETISQALLNAVDRDALSGWGAHVYIIEKDKVTKRLLKGRQD